jgi:hypothetical protein
LPKESGHNFQKIPKDIPSAKEKPGAGVNSHPLKRDALKCEFKEK